LSFAFEFEFEFELELEFVPSTRDEFKKGLLLSLEVALFLYLLKEPFSLNPPHPQNKGAY
jgi:hypothetical protein